MLIGLPYGSPRTKCIDMPNFSKAQYFMLMNRDNDSKPIRKQYRQTLKMLSDAELSEIYLITMNDIRDIKAVQKARKEARKKA